MTHEPSVPPPPRTVSPSGTVVLGLGNSLLCDDAVGLRVAAALQERLDANPVEGVTVVTSIRGGFDLIDLLAGASHAIIIDCLDVQDPQPGRVRRLDPHEAGGAARLVGAHDLDVASALELGRELGVPMPETVEIYGVEAVEIRQFGEHLTPPVEAAAATLSRDLHTLLKARSRNRA